MRPFLPFLLTLSLLTFGCTSKSVAPPVTPVTPVIKADEPKPGPRLAEVPKGWYLVKNDECSFALPSQVREIKGPRKKGEPIFTAGTKDNKFMFAFNYGAEFTTLKKLSESTQSEMEEREAEVSQIIHTEIDETDALAIVAASEHVTAVAFLMVKNHVAFTLLCGTPDGDEASAQRMASTCEEIAKTFTFAKQ